MPAYPSAAAVAAVEERLRRYPPLVSISEIRQLKQQLAAVAAGCAHVLQGGDCAESFADYQAQVIRSHYSLLNDMAALISRHTRRPVLRIGRIAGQYAKPRSQDYEVVEGLSLPSYRGDIINDLRFDAAARVPDPARMETAYHTAAGTLNLLRSLGAGENGYFTSHEALLLPYEQALLEQEGAGRWYACSGHFLWIGERTRQLDSAHVEFLRGVANPIGVKLGPEIQPDELLQLIERLDPDHEPGRLTLISRLGVAAIGRLPALLGAVRATGRRHVWLCDPMHGNPAKTASGLKTRHFDVICAEIHGFVAAHEAAGTHPGGLHLELSGLPVTECLGGPDALDEGDLELAYQTYCDPRLNPEQALEAAAVFATAVPAGTALPSKESFAMNALLTPAANPWPQRLNLAAFLIASKGRLAKPCFIGPAGALSYTRLDTEVRRAASAMSLLGVAPGERVAVALDDSLELAVVFFASLAIGALPFALNPNLDAEPLAHVLKDARPVLLFGKSSHAETLRSALAAVQRPPLLALADAGSLLGTRADWMPEGADPSWDSFHVQDADAPAFLQYTSGTTGNSKGVVHTAASILAACEDFAAQQLNLQADDVLYSVPKIFFGYGMGNSLFFPLYLGATAVLDPSWPSAESVAGNLQRYRPTVLFAVPTLYRMLLDSPLSAQDCAVRLAFSAGAPLSELIADAWQARFGIPLYDGIGATELGHVFATTYPHAQRPGSLGRMVAGWAGRIVNLEGRDCEPGEVGVLLVQAGSMARGYWNRDEDTAAKFQDGWYRTGDLFSCDADGYLYFHGREDDRFKVYGRWVVPVEIENLLARHCPEAGEAYLVAGCDARGEYRPVLFLRGGKEGFAAKAEAATAVLARHLESYKQPVLCLPLEALPLTPNGKLNRRALGVWAGLALSQAAQPAGRPVAAEQEEA